MRRQTSTYGMTAPRSASQPDVVGVPGITAVFGMLLGTAYDVPVKPRENSLPPGPLIINATSETDQRYPCNKQQNGCRTYKLQKFMLTCDSCVSMYSIRTPHLNARVRTPTSSNKSEPITRLLEGVLRHSLHETRVPIFVRRFSRTHHFAVAARRA